MPLANPLPDTVIFHAGTGRHDGKLVTAGGRVLAATAVAGTLEEAVKKAYAGVETVKFQDMYFRKDIAHRYGNTPWAS